MGSKRNHKNVHKTKKRKSKKIYGGIAAANTTIPDIAFKIEQHKIENVEAITFLIDFLNRQEFKIILLENYKFINGIDLDNNLSKNFDFTNNPQYRKIISDTIQWFVLDYNKQFVNSILGIVKTTLMNANFLNKSIDINNRYNILLLNISNMIDTFGGESKENIEINALLRIILKVLTLSSVKQNIMGIITSQGDNIINLKYTIICLLDNLIKTDLLHDEKIRKLLKEYIEQLTYKTVFDWDNIKKLSGLVGTCTGSLTADVGTTAIKSAYNNTFGFFSKK